MTLPPVVRAAYSNIDVVADLIAESFVDLPATAWLIPDAHRRHTVLRSNFKIFVEHAMFYGAVDILVDHSGVVVWMHRDRPFCEPTNYAQRQAAACGPYTDRFQTLDKLLDTHHPTRPHHHLAFLAVHPGLQCTGRGTALLRHRHAILDQAGVSAYVESSSTGSRDLYTRLGYQPREPFTLPDGTPFFPGWRPPDRPGNEPGS